MQSESHSYGGSRETMKPFLLYSAHSIRCLEVHTPSECARIIFLLIHLRRTAVQLPWCLTTVSDPLNEVSIFVCYVVSCTINCKSCCQQLFRVQIVWIEVLSGLHVSGLGLLNFSEFWGLSHTEQRCLLLQRRAILCVRISYNSNLTFPHFLGKCFFSLSPNLIFSWRMKACAGEKLFCFD